MSNDLGLTSDSPEWVDLLIKDENARMAAKSQADAVSLFFTELDGWIKQSAAQVANGHIPDPAPIPPPGYSVPVPVPPPPPAPLNFTPNVGSERVEGRGPAYYPSPNDANPEGVQIPNPYVLRETLKKRMTKTPFGTASAWVVIKS